MFKVEPVDDGKGQQVGDLSQKAEHRQPAEVRYQCEEEQGRKDQEEPLSLGHRRYKVGQVLGDENQVAAAKPHLKNWSDLLVNLHTTFFRKSASSNYPVMYPKKSLHVG